MSAPVMSKAGRYGIELRDGAPGSLDDHERPAGVERLELLVGPHEAGGREPELPAQRVRGLVGALPDAEAGVTLERADDVRHQLGRRGRRAHRVAGRVPEPHPAEEPRGSGRVEQRPLLRDLPVELGERPRLEAGPHQRDAGLRHLVEPLLAARRLLAERRRVREPEGEQLLPRDGQDPGSIERDVGHASTSP